MKKTLKLVGIFMAILTVGFAGGISVYTLFQKNKTYHIYDLRIVEPVEGASSYIYLDPDYDYTAIKNTEVYMNSEKEDMLGIAVYSNTSDNRKDVKIKSSDTSVAEIVYKEGKCFVKYKKAGVATITASIDKVEDTFDLYVYNKSADVFEVYDDYYYGKYASINSNKIVAYADDITYKYNFVVNSSFSENDDDEVNCQMLRVDQSSVNSEVFEKVQIDPASQKLIVQCKSSFSDTLIAQQKHFEDELIAIQSFYYSSEGDLKPNNKPYYVNVHIIADTPEFLQIEMSATPDFEDSFIFMDTKDFSDASEDDILADIDEFLLYQKAEQYLSENGENSTYNMFLTDKVSEVYMKFRKVYTNGDIVYLNPLTEIEDNPFDIDCDDGYLTVSQNSEYYTLKINRDYFESGEIIARSFNIKLTLNDFVNFYSNFKIEFKEFNANNLALFYDYDKDTGVFTYKYWDTRTSYNNEICNTSGQIVGFGGIEIDYSVFD